MTNRSSLSGANLAHRGPARRATDPAVSAHVRRSAGWALFVVLGLAGVSMGQDPPPLPDLLPGEDEVRTGEWIASDGQPAVAGRIPSDTDPVALARLAKLNDRFAKVAPLRSFRLRFDALLRGEATQEFKTELRYLDAGPGWVSGAILHEDGTVKQSSMRGPRADGGKPYYWQVLKDGQVQPLVGPEWTESREEVDGWAALCHDMLLLQQPQRMRLMRVTARQAERVGAEGLEARALRFGPKETVWFPDTAVDVDGRGQRLAERASELEWLELLTPDIRLWREKPGAGAARRVLLGIDPVLGIPELAFLSQRAEGDLLDRETTLLHLGQWGPYKGRADSAEGAATGGQGEVGGTAAKPSEYWLPLSTRVFELRRAEGAERDSAQLAFNTRSTLDLFLRSGGELGGTPPSPESFRPQE